jgi:hypothetical protein
MSEVMTAEKAIKLKAHAIIMRFKNAGVPWAHCGTAGIVLVWELKEQYFKNFTGTKEERIKANDRFERLERDVKGFLPVTIKTEPATND